MLRVVGRIVLLSSLLFLLPPDTLAQEKSGDLVGRFGVGLSGSFSFPVGGLERRHRATESFGLLISYIKTARSTIEVEYHRTRFDPGKMEDAQFFWPPTDPTTWKIYTSPLARNYFTVNAFTINGLYHFADRNAHEPEGLKQRVAAGPYIVYGGGFYHYTDSVAGLIFSGQPDLGSGLDDTLLIESFEDTDVGWGFNLGGGAEVMMSNTASLDVRARYHLIIGELRQMDAYNVKRAYPLHYVDIGVTMKFYFTSF